MGQPPAMRGAVRWESPQVMGISRPPGALIDWRRYFAAPFSAPCRSAASAEVGVCGAGAWAAGAGGAAGSPLSAPVSVPQAAAPKKMAVAAMAAARAEYRLRRPVVLVFMVVPLVGGALGVWWSRRRAVTAQTDAQGSLWIRASPGRSRLPTIRPAATVEMPVMAGELDVSRGRVRASVGHEGLRSRRSDCGGDADDPTPGGGGAGRRRACRRRRCLGCPGGPLPSPGDRG